MTLPADLETSMAPLAAPTTGTLSRFHIAALAFQRTHQLKHGARPRVDAGSHKVVTVAVLEVLADTISWTTS